MTRPGHDGMPPQGPDFAEFLRRELHAAADQLEPRSDGLERIRARVRSGPAYASKHSAAQGGFLAGLVRRWNPARGGQEEGGGHPRQQRDWRYGLLRPALAAACAVFAIGVALAVPPLREAFVQLGSAVGISSHSAGGGVQSTNGDGTPIGSAAGGAGGGTSAAQGSAPAIACASSSASSAPAKPAQADDLGDAERHPGELGEQPVRQRHGQRDERRPGRRQHQPGRHHDRNRPGDRDRERHRHEHRHLDGFGEGQHQREGQGVRQGDRDTLLSAQHRHTVQEG